MTVTVDTRTCQDLDRAVSLEWLETNGLGGYASGTVAGANSRRYHALLLVARNPPLDRVVLVNHLEERVDLDGQSVALSTNLYRGAVDPEGFRYCDAFSPVPWPTWRYHVAGITLRREICCLPGRDLVIVRWSLDAPSTAAIVLRVRPMLSGRDFHALHQENVHLRPAAEMSEGRVTWQPYRTLPAVQALHNGTYRHEPYWYRQVEYPIERERGLDHVEDWWSPGEWQFTLGLGKSAELVLTTEANAAVDVALSLTAEGRRREGRARSRPTEDPLVRRLWEATEAFLSRRGTGHTVMAGYPWFADWGRDACIALPGLCLVTGRYDIARQVIEAFASELSQGIVPNRFTEGGAPDYNSIDASLWFVHAVDRYLHYSRDFDGIRKVAWPAIKQIVEGYRCGTRYGIRVDDDGLVTGGIDGVQLTWMDVKVGEWVVTPRHGKPVEVQALWVRALAIAASWADQCGEPAYAERCRQDRRRAVESFRARFWYPAGRYLFDVVDGPTGDDASLRPNQVYALALDDELVPGSQALQVLQVLKERLLTPVGLRTLVPEDIRFCPVYVGTVAERDGAYHQGTVWPFLLGPFVTAWVRKHGGEPAARREAREFLAGLEAHLDEACIGQVSEIFDGQAPHLPRGCFAQAWSVAEPLRALIEDIAR